MKIGLAAVLVAGIATPGFAHMSAQMTGVSHPEQVQIVTGQDGIPQPVLYQSQPAMLVPPMSATVAAEPPAVLHASTVAHFERRGKACDQA